MGRQPRSGDIPWLSAHSILNWIGGDVSMLILSRPKSSVICRNVAWLRDCLQRFVSPCDPGVYGRGFAELEAPPRNVCPCSPGQVPGSLPTAYQAVPPALRDCGRETLLRCVGSPTQFSVWQANYSQ